jgi:hypothetical protein
VRLDAITRLIAPHDSPSDPSSASPEQP